MIVDDADCLDHDLAITLIENLAGRHDSMMLVVAAVNPDSTLAASLTDQGRWGITRGLVRVADADPNMGYRARLNLARELCPDLPDVAVRRIARRTATFVEVFTVAATPGLAEVSPGKDEDEVLAIVDAAVSLRLARPTPSREAVLLAWAGGLAHARQVDRALEILGTSSHENDPDVRRWGSLRRLADPVAPRLSDRDQVAVALAAADRRAIAAAFLGEALTLAADPHIGMADRTAALLATYRVRNDLADRGKLPRAERELAACLEALGDYTAAVEVAITALDEWPDDTDSADDKDALAATVLRLSRVSPQRSASGTLAEKLIAEAIAGGAALGLEARA